MEIPLVLNEKYLQCGIEQYVTWSDKAPHMVVFGATGSGKTYCTKLILARVSKMIKDSQFYICDFKGDNDFSYLNGTDRFFRFMECEKSLDAIMEILYKRQSNELNDRNMIILYFDEWASYILNIDKKKAEEEKKKLATLLMLGRSYNIHVMVSQQRVDASYFSSARDNFNLVIALGNLSSEGKEMMFREFKDQMKPDRKQGTGYMITNGTDFTPILVPTISDMNLVNAYIKDAVTR